jgi:hypothetical protein
MAEEEECIPIILNHSVGLLDVPACIRLQLEEYNEDLEFCELWSRVDMYQTAYKYDQNNDNMIRMFRSIDYYYIHINNQDEAVTQDVLHAYRGTTLWRPGVQRPPRWSNNVLMVSSGAFGLRY